MYNKSKENLILFLVSCIIGIILILLNSVIIMIGWNALMPMLFGISSLSYSQSVILYIFISVLFKDSTPIKMDYDKNN